MEWFVGSRVVNSIFRYGLRGSSCNYVSQVHLEIPYGLIKQCWQVSRHGGRSLRSPPCRKSRTDTNRKSKQWTTPKPTQNNHPHSSRCHDFKYQIPLIWYFQPIRDHVSFSWCCLDWLSTPPFIESYCYFTVLELSTGAQQIFFFLAIKDHYWTRKSHLCLLLSPSPPSTQR